LIVTAAFAFLWASLEGGPLLQSAIVLLAAATSAVYWSARPHLFTLLLTAAVVWIVRLHAGQTATAVPGNPRHGAVDQPPRGFIAGFVVLGIVVAKRFSSGLGDGGGLAFPRSSLPVRTTLIALGGSLLAACFNPFGPEMLSTPSNHLDRCHQDYIQEWQCQTSTRIWSGRFSS
jgi:hypothetical protein